MAPILPDIVVILLKELGFDERLSYLKLLVGISCWVVERLLKKLFYTLFLIIDFFFNQSYISIGKNDS
jgi:hypothetical protein